jgi:hypothetical protein
MQRKETSRSKPLESIRMGTGINSKFSVIKQIGRTAEKQEKKNPSS